MTLLKSIQQKNKPRPIVDYAGQYHTSQAIVSTIRRHIVLRTESNLSESSAEVFIEEDKILNSHDVLPTTHR